MKYKRYPSYKDSGVEWLGKIPNLWHTVRIADISKLINGYPFDSDKFDPNNGTPLVRIRDIDSSKTVVRFDGFIPNVAKIDNDDILIGMDGDFNVSWWNGGKAALNQRVACIRSKSKKLQRFIYYSLPFNLKLINDLTYYTTVKHLSSTDIVKTKIALPNIEMEYIVNFLDIATQKIDTLIEKQKKLIELLKEKRKAVISHAVTRGLDPDVKLKDSGVEWLGEVPEHWKIGLLSTLFDNNKAKNSGMKNQNLLSLSYGKIVNKNIDTAFGLLPESFESYQIVKPGYIILRLTDLQNDKKSLRTGLVTQEGIITSAYIGLKKKSKLVGNEKFIHYYLHTFDIYKGFYGMGSGVRQSLNYDELKKLKFVLPLPEEQDEIVKYIDDKISKIDSLVEKATKAIALLKEKRIALISAAVTGKIDVREEV